MTTILYNKSKKNLIGEINLPASKSISNRALILQYLAKDSFSILNQSLAGDSVLLDKILKKLPLLSNNQLLNEIFVDNAGTAMRFLTALLSITKGNWILTGSERMEKRPIAHLVDALNGLGANISYKGNHDFPPLLINGQSLKGGSIDIKTNTSSQFVTSLLLIAPFLEYGLSLTFKGNTVSKPYIIMTLKMLNYFGIEYAFVDNSILIKKQSFQAKDIFIESDWSAASYWYEMAVFSSNVDLKLNGLTNKRWQGDAIIAEIFQEFGVNTEFLNDNVRLAKTKSLIKSFSYDFTDYPDIAPTIAVCCAGLGIRAELKGLESLAIKECNRLNALETELNKMGCKAISVNNNLLQINPSTLNSDKIIHTYNDHRMAMSFAPLAIILENLKLDNIDVVKKSYPNFGNDLQSVGFKIE